MKLMISLGHNSSAVLAVGKKVLCGYEEERLSKVKSDSSYPKLAIEEILGYYPDASTLVTHIYITHWFDLDKGLIENKYYQPKHLKARFPNAEIVSHTEEFTHHDAHAASVWNFSGTSAGLTMVADGFGNNGETVSIYKNGLKVDTIRSISLGLMYQYMTSFLGMKENQDEYKMLGMETKAELRHKDKLDSIADTHSDILFKAMVVDNVKLFDYPSVCAINKSFTYTLFDSLNFTSDAGKAYCVQRVLETVVLDLLEHYGASKESVLQFSGGIFYNVKLNNCILNDYADSVSLIEFMPVCGDQGAALGFTKLDITDFFWGKRFMDDIEEVKGQLVYKMSGHMEFGPRALGNTSCIALPTKDNVELINKLNGRPNIMPMAPMVHPSVAVKYLKNVSKLGKCKNYMICALDWTGPIEGREGALHKKPFEDVYTARAQIVNNHYTKKYGVVINTSLNAHGQPILYNLLDYNKMEKIHDKNYGNLQTGS